LLVASHNTLAHQEFFRSRAGIQFHFKP
jgi:hypothetical protein